MYLYRRHRAGQLRFWQLADMILTPLVISASATLFGFCAALFIASWAGASDSFLNELVFMPLTWLGLYLMIATSTFCLYWWRLSRQKFDQQRVGDLPWWRVWPWVVGLLLGPVAWICLVVSYRLVRQMSFRPEPTEGR